MTDEEMKKKKNFHFVIIQTRWSQEFHSDAGYFSPLNLADKHVPPAVIHVFTCGLAGKRFFLKKTLRKITLPQNKKKKNLLTLLPGEH